MPVSITSAYDKLGNLPLAVSETLLEEGTQRMNSVLPEIPAVHPLPDCWADHEVFTADGKSIKHVKRLLKPLRGLRARILGARASVRLNLRTGLAVAMVGHLDGEAGEAALTEVLLPKLAAAAGPGKQWVVVLDRLYCNLSFSAAGLESRGPFPHPLLHQYDVRPRSGPTGPGEPRRQRAPDRSRVGLAGQG